MCIRPIPLKGSFVACRKCWQCRDSVVSDWVGRCIAETKTCTASHSITLTYGRDGDGNSDHPRAAVLTYSDVQKYLKRLRANGYPCRYFVAGEYGSLKGRAHWHALLFWQDLVPDHRLSVGEAVRFDERHWPHGVSHWEKPNAKSIRYVCKYILKDAANFQQGHVIQSRKPPLGDAYFKRLAAEYVSNGLAPQDAFYTFPDAWRAGRKIRFRMRGVTLDNFLSEYLRLWAVRRGGHPPTSEFLEDWCDKRHKLDIPFRTDQNWFFHHADEAHRKGETRWQNEAEPAERPVAATSASDTTKADYLAASQPSRMRGPSLMSKPRAR